jgi:hypothetical protein
VTVGAHSAPLLPRLAASETPASPSQRTRFDRASEHPSVGIDHEQCSKSTVKERQAVATFIFVDSAFASTRDPTFSHQGLNDRRFDAEAFRNQRGVHTDRLAVELDSALIGNDHALLSRLIRCEVSPSSERVALI